MTHLLFLALLALAPAAFAWRTGRTLIAFADDPALPERLLASRGPRAVISAISLALMVPFGLKHLAWTLPLLIVARMAAGYRVRRVLYRETWSFGAYLSFFIRLVVAGYGLWVAIGLMPVIASMAGSRDWIAGGALAAILSAWSASYGRVFCTILRGRPVDDSRILPRFADIVQQCGLQNVSLQQVDMRGGVFANAVALPAVAHPAVLVSSTLLERLDADETAGILAHEVAHLEQYNPRVLRGLGRVTYSLITAGALLSPAVRLAFPQSRGEWLMLWAAAVIVTLAFRARHRQKRETESDLRAMALTGNADALVRALTKLHAFAHVPRRWDTEVERQATHPSLARRIQAIRQAAGAGGALLAESAAFVDPTGRRSVTFHADRLEFNEGAAGSHAIAYGLLTSLRVDARLSAAPRLVAIDSSKRRWDLALQPSDLARAQATLDIVDSRLGAAAASSIAPAVPRLIAMIALLLSLMTGQIALMLVTWLAVLQPSSSLVGGVGAAAIAAAGLVWRGDTYLIQSEPWMALALLASGAALIAMGAMNREEPTTPRTRMLIAALAVAAACAFALIIASGTDALALHRGAREWPSATVLMLGLAGALAFSRSKRVRYAAAPVACAGLAAWFLGSTTFLVRFVDDPFVAQAEPIAIETVAADPAAVFTVPYDVDRLWLSPGGGYVALSSEDKQEQVSIHAGPARGPLTDFEADDAAFVGEARLLLLERQRTTAVLRLVDLERGNREVWSRRVHLWAGRLSIGHRSNRWLLLGWNESGGLASVAGRIGEDAATEEQWKTPGTDMNEIVPLAVRNGAMLAVETRYISPAAASSALQLWAAAMVQPTERSQSQLWAIGQQDRIPFAASRLPLNCLNTSLDEPVDCVAFDGMNTGFFAVDPAARHATAVAAVNGHFHLRGDSGGWFTGWLDGSLVLIKPSTREGIRISRRDAREADHVLTASDNVMGSVSSNLHTSTVRLYPMKPKN